MRDLIKTRFLAIAASALAACTLLGAANDVTPAPVDSVIASASAYSGRVVNVRGPALRIVQRTMGAAPSYLFRVCELKCLTVYANGYPRFSEGETVRVRGIFAAHRRIGRVVVRNTLQARSVASTGEAQPKLKLQFPQVRPLSELGSDLPD